MPIYDEIKERFKGDKKGSKEKMHEEMEKKAMKKPKKMAKSSSIVGAAGLPKKGKELLMPLGKKGLMLGLLGDKFGKI